MVFTPPNIGQSSLLRNSLLNLSGMVLPSLFALVAIPLCVRVYGDEQFGLLSLAWMFIVSFAFLDLGLGISTTKYTAELLRKEQTEKIPGLIWSAVTINILSGVVFAFVIFQGAGWISHQLIRPTVSLREQTIASIQYAALTLPFIMPSASLRGVLEASNRFDITNGIKVPSSSLLFLIPALGALVSLPISTVVLWLTISRIVTAGAFLYFVAQVYPVMFKKFYLDVEQAKTFLRFGGWVSVSSLLGPVIMQGEKLVIPAILSIGVLSYYSAPYEMVARIGIIPFSLAIAMLPKFSYLGKTDTVEQRGQLFLRPLKYLLVIMTPLASGFVFFSEEILTLWLGQSFVSTSSTVLAVLGIAFFFNAFGYVGFSAVQGLGHPELKAKLDAVLAPVFLVLCWVMVSRLGLLGAAVTKLVVLCADAAGLFWLLKNILRVHIVDIFSPQLRRMLFVSLFLLLSGMVLHAADASFVLRLAVFIAGLVILGSVSWRSLMNAEEAHMLRNALVRVPARSGQLVPEDRT